MSRNEIDNQYWILPSMSALTVRAWPSQNRKLRSFVRGLHGLDGVFSVFLLKSRVVRVIRVQKAVLSSIMSKPELSGETLLPRGDASRTIVANV